MELIAFLPEALLNHFDIEFTQELGEVSYKRMVHLTKKNKLPTGYKSLNYESKGFINL